MKKIKICVIGMGEFSDFFIPLFRDHPDVEEVSIADVIPERITAAAKKHGIKRYFNSLEDVLKNGKDVDSIALFTQRHLHGPMVIDALKAGKHIFSAVPMALDAEECGKIIDLVKSTRLVYMTGETCYYFPCAIFCRDMLAKGQFGKFVYAEAQYYHDMQTFYSAFARSGGDTWKRVAGIPPMYYATHSTSMIISVVGQYATKVSCMGYRDMEPDEVFGIGKNNWDNPFSNQTALLTLSGGGIARVNEFRRVGIAHKPSSYISNMYGTTGSYECAADRHMLIRGVANEAGTYIEDVSAQINTEYLTERRTAADYDPHTEPISERAHRGFAPVHDVARLPKKLQQIPDTVHYNSHPFLVDDFVRAVVENKLPPNNAWDSARYMLPGVMAHESALRDGLLMDIPDFGDAPADWDRLTFERRYDD